MIEGNTGVRFVNITLNGVLNNNNTQVYAIKNPLVHIYNSLTPYDWYTNNSSYQNNVLWENGKGKSIYDPCPKKWKVPTDGSYGNFSATTIIWSGSGTNIANGESYKGIAWFPATGYRYYATGLLSLVGSYGYYWFSSTDGAYAKNFVFFINGVYPISSNLRAYGYSVRCVQE